MTEFLWSLVLAAAGLLAVATLVRPRRLDCGCRHSAGYTCRTCGYTQCPDHRLATLHDCNLWLRSRDG